MRAAKRPSVPEWLPIAPPAAPPAPLVAEDQCGKKDTEVCVGTVFLWLGLVLVLVLAALAFFLLCTKKQVKEGMSAEVLNTSDSIYDSAGASTAR